MITVLKNIGFSIAVGLLSPLIAFNYCWLNRHKVTIPIGDMFIKMMIPFAILRVRWIQYRYKKITLGNLYNRSTINYSRLVLLQAKEHHYKTMFDAYGLFHPDCVVTKKHHHFMNWLFPEKDFEEWDMVVWHKYDAVCYYHNKIFTLSRGKEFRYDVEIKNQLKEWKKRQDKIYSQAL